MASLLPRPRLPNTRQQGPRINRNPTVVDSGMQINLPSGYGVQEQGGALVHQRGMQEAPRADQYAVPSHHTQHIDMGLANRVVQDGYRADLSNRADGILADLRGERQMDDYFNAAENFRQSASIHKQLQDAIDMPVRVNSIPERNPGADYRHMGRSPFTSNNSANPQPMRSAGRMISRRAGDAWGNTVGKQHNRLVDYIDKGTSRPREQAEIAAGTLEAIGLTAAGVGLYQLGAGLGNAFGGPADEQERGQLGM